MTFESVMEFTRTVSSHAAFEDHECRLFYETLCKLPIGSQVLEIGVEYGRSSSIILQVAKERKFYVNFIDPFVDPASKPAFIAMAGRIGHPYRLIPITTAEACRSGIPANLNFIHIDGDHTAESVRVDCGVMVMTLRPEGYACFHDYGRDSLPDVFPTVNEFIDDRWEKQIAGTLLVARKPL